VKYESLNDVVHCSLGCTERKCSYKVRHYR